MFQLLLSGYWGSFKYKNTSEKPKYLKKLISKGTLCFLGKKWLKYAHLWVAKTDKKVKAT